MQRTLLLADDSVTIQRVIELTFADEDVRVVAVGDGDEAIAALDEAPPDIVLADVGMPGRNGYEVAQHIRDTPHLSHIPVLLLTGAFEPVDQIRAADVGCAGVLAKPFEPQLVIGRVKELLARPRSTPDPLDRPLVAAGDAASSWPSTVEEPTVLRQPPGPSERADVDQYFDHLDRAFANRTLESAEAGPTQTHIPSAENRGSQETRTPREDEPAAVAQAGTLSGAPALEATPHGASASVALADVFAALLAAEQTEPGSAEPDAPRFVSALAPPAVTDDVIEEVVRRVLERLPDRVVRETVTDIVTAAAERLVREEIERIKGKIL